MPQLIAGNWKMNGLRAEAMALCEALRAGARGLACHLLVCPPATVLAEVARALGGTPIGVGGQDCAPEKSGAYTGDISAPMLRDAGANFVILGHSERRHGHGETSAQVRAKAAAAVRAGLTPIVCVGETEAERDGGRAEDVVGAQVRDSLPPGFAGVLAYEPVWAIGTGKTATEADVGAMHAYIRGILSQEMAPGLAGQGMPILYGGSVKPGNAASLLAVPEVGGALVGGASLIAADFLAIARAAIASPGTAAR
jgi:triosephosphate isomerase (TIM)